MIGRLNAPYAVVTRVRALRGFSSDQFDLVCAWLVLQHMPPRLMRRYIPELVRLVSPGGLLVFQLPASIDTEPEQAFCDAPVVGGRLKRSLPLPLVRAYRRVKFQTRRRLIPHMEMFAMPVDAVVDLLQRSGGTVCRVEPDDSHGMDVSGFLYWVTKADRQSDS